MKEMLAQVGYDQPAAACPRCAAVTEYRGGYVPYARVCPQCGVVCIVEPAGFADANDPAKGLAWTVEESAGEAPIGPFDPAHSASFPPGPRRWTETVSNAELARAIDSARDAIQDAEDGSRASRDLRGDLNALEAEAERRGRRPTAPSSQT